MTLPLTETQHHALAHTGSQLLIGAAGSGKTTLLVEKVAQLVGQGVTPEHIALATFASRTLQALQAQLADRLPQHATRVRVATVHDLAVAQLTAAGQEPGVQGPAFATNNHVRQLLRSLVREQSFPGTLAEAEMLVRAMKSRGKKVAENDRNYPFYLAYQETLKAAKLADRNDILRSHILAMRGGSASAVPVKWLLVDNLQDATELQLSWLKEHLAAGATLWLAGNDDITAFGREGGLGAAALEQVQGWGNVQTKLLEETFRLPHALSPAVDKVARLLKHRLPKPVKPQPRGSHAAPGTFKVQGFASATEEHIYLANLAKEHAKNGQRVGLVTRDDETANLVAHALRKQGFSPASYARLVWEEPAAQQVLGLLAVLLDRGTDDQLAGVLTGFGLPPEAVALLQARGLSADHWLARNCPLPPGLAQGAEAGSDLSPTILAQLSRVHRHLTSAWHLLHSRAMSAQDVFKALIYVLLENIPPADQPSALLATDMLLNIPGNPADALPKVVVETMPNPHAPVVVAPVREVRNLEFDILILPHAHAGQWPAVSGPALGEDAEHERRLFHLALSRSKGNILATHHKGLSPLVKEAQGYVR